MVLIPDISQFYILTLALNPLKSDPTCSFNHTIGFGKGISIFLFAFDAKKLLKFLLISQDFIFQSVHSHCLVISLRLLEKSITNFTLSLKIFQILIILWKHSRAISIIRMSLEEFLLIKFSVLILLQTKTIGGMPRVIENAF